MSRALFRTQFSSLFSLPLLLSFFSLTGCNHDSPTQSIPAPQTYSGGIEPTAGGWRTWVISSGSAIRPVAPTSDVGAELDEVRWFISQRTNSIEAQISYWQGGTTRRWNEYQRHLLCLTAYDPPRAARGLGLVSVAMYDAMVAAWDAKYAYKRLRPYQYDTTLNVYGIKPNSPSYVSERAAIGTAAADLLTYLYPAFKDSIEELLTESVFAELYAGVHFRSDITAGQQIGHAVAAQVLDRARNDRSDLVWDGSRPNGPGLWQPTPSGYFAPLEPMCGKWKTWIIPDGSALRPPPPPPFGSDEFNAQIQEVYEINQTLTADRLAIAHYWVDGPGTANPPGHWNQIAVDMAVWKELSEPRMARMLALLGTAQADAFIACWDCKFTFWVARPVTMIREDYDSTWLPPLQTPPFPSYPSGHSTTSGAASTILGYLFPDQAVFLRLLATEAMNSRLYGGIHYSVDDLTGMGVGSSIGLRAINIAVSDGAPDE